MFQVNNTFCPAISPLNLDTDSDMKFSDQTFMMSRMIPVGMMGLSADKISSFAIPHERALAQLRAMENMTDASMQAAVDALADEEMQKKAKIADSMAAALMAVSSHVVCHISNSTGEEPLLL